MSEQTVSPSDSAAGSCGQMVYIPGSALSSSPDAELRAMARRVARVLDQNDPDIGASYRVRAAPSEAYGDGDAPAFAPVCEIVRKNGSEAEKVVRRLYWLDYHPLLDADTGGGNLYAQLGKMLLLWWDYSARYLRRLVRLFDKRRLSFADHVAYWIGGALLALVSLYIVIFALSVLHVIGAEAGSDGIQTATAWLEAHSQDCVIFRLVVSFVEKYGKIAALLTSLPLLAAGFRSFRSALEKAASILLRMGSYYTHGLGRSACVGRLNDLIEHICEKGPSAKDLTVMGYSLGSVVALDAIFPANGEPMPRLEALRALVTIGCPFEAVENFYPGYFRNRSIPAALPYWINVYSPVDLLGSDFSKAIGIEGDRREKKASEAPLKPNLDLAYDHAGRQKRSFWEALSLAAFAAHAQYWRADDPEAESCLRPVLAGLARARSAI